MKYKPHGKLPDGIPPIIPPFKEEPLWTVDKTVRFITRDGWLVTMHKGEKSDLASMPRPARIFFGDAGKETVAALFHDHVYKHRKDRVHVSMGTETHVLTWRECNVLMYDVMILAGVSWIRRHSIMTGLWIGSFPVWFNYGKKKKEV